MNTNMNELTMDQMDMVNGGFDLIGCIKGAVIGGIGGAVAGGCLGGPAGAVLGGVMGGAVGAKQKRSPKGRKRGTNNE